MKRGYKGSVTIYLALIFWVLMALVFTVVENVRSQAARLSLECTVDLALYSVFAEYQRELLEQYDLFFIDTGYGSTPSMENVKSHFKNYMDENFDLSVDGAGIGLCDFLQMRTTQVEITGISRATDEKGEVFKRQAVSYMKERYGVSYLGDFSGQFEDTMREVTDLGLLIRDIEAERKENQSKIDAIDIPPIETDEGEYQEVVLDNPADAVHASRSAGILNLVVDDTSSLSGRGISPEKYASGRKASKGDGLLGREKTALADDLWYHEYIIDKCSCYTDQTDKALLKYQTEYILAGRDNDMDNLKWVVDRLLLIREAANVTYLFTDSAKMAEAEALALTLAAVMRAPDLAEPVKVSILFAWAYAESVYDVKQLLLSQKVPLVKDKENWHYSLSGMLHFQSDLPQAAESSGRIQKPAAGMDISGLSYKDYLRILLTTVSEKASVFRMMDIIEMDIRKTPGGGSFYMDGCVDAVKVRAYGGSRFDFIWQIDREYHYF